MKKQLIGFTFLFLICLLMPSVAMADLRIRISVLSASGGRSFAISTIKSVTFTARVTDEDWSPVSGQTVTFSVSPDDGIVSLSTTSATTDSNGHAQTTVSLSSESSETTYRLRATLDNGEWDWAPAIVWDGAELTLGVDGPGSSYEPGESVRFTFRLRIHRKDDALAGRTVTFSVSPDDGTVSLSPTSATTDSNGEASTTLITGSGSSGSYTVTASGGGYSINYTVTVETSSSPPPTNPNPDPPEVNSRSEVRQIPQEQRAAPEDSAAQPQQTAPTGSTSNTPAHQTAPRSSTGNTQGTPRSVTTNTPADTTRTQTPDTPEQQASDLVIDALKVNKNVLDAGESFTLSAVVRNQSEESSSTATLTYYQYFDDKSVEKVGESEIASLAAGETTDVSITLTAPETSGTHSYYACISTHCTSIVKISVRSEIKELVISSGDSQTGTPNKDLPNPISVQVLDEDGVGVPHVKVVFRVVSGTARMRKAGGPKRWRGATVRTDSAGYAKAYVTPADTETIKIRASVVTDTSLLDAYGLDPVIFTVNPDQAGGAPSAQFPQSHVTALLANYPNPFNPETWIPYRLAKASEVVVEIFASNGQVVRRLQLGHQPAGIYQSRSRAAYWDGKNEDGEPVASGVYFYTLTAGDFTATRKMLILK